MATTTIPWGDGSGDNIYLTYTSASGNQTVQVSSDPNDGPARTKDITFVSSVGNIARVLTVTQETNMDYVSITWNDTCITYNDTAIAYPYVEPYIVFVDSEVEAICATKWGDGIGLKPSQAAQVTNSQFGTTFGGKTDISYFEEFAYFTSVTQLTTGAFSNSTIERLVVPSSVRTIDRAFQNCSSLKYLELPDGVNIRYNNTFPNVSQLAEITFRGTYSGAVSLFSGCTSLKRANIVSIDVWASMNLSQTVTIGQVSNELHLYLIGSEVEITDLTIPGSIGYVGSWTFYYCVGLTSATIGEGVTSIGDAAFRNCTGITIVDIPSTVSTIGSYVFNNVGTTTNKCTFIVRATTPPTLGTQSFIANNTNKIYVPYGTMSAYKSAANWNAGTLSPLYAELNPDGTIPT